MKKSFICILMFFSVFLTKEQKLYGQISYDLSKVLPENYIPYYEEKNFFPIRKIRIAFHIINGVNQPGIDHTTVPNNQSGNAFINAILSEMNYLMENNSVEGNQNPCGVNMSFELQNNKHPIEDTRLRYILEDVTFVDNESYYNLILSSWDLNGDIYDYIHTPLILNNASYSPDYKNNIIHVYLVNNSFGGGMTCGNGGALVSGVRGKYDNWLNYPNQDLFIAKTINHEISHILGLVDVKTNPINSISFIDYNIGFIALAKSVFKTENGGISWNEYSFNCTAEINSLFF